MEKAATIVIISTATLVEIVEGEKVEREPGWPVSLPAREALGLIDRGLAVLAGGAGDVGEGGEGPPPDDAP